MRIGPWVKSLCLVGGIGLSWHLLGYEKNTGQWCTECGSTRRLEGWGLGNPEGLHLGLHHDEEESPSWANRDLFDGRHAHRWSFWHSYTRSGLWGVIACGRMRRNRFARDYEHDPEFRRFVSTKIRQGALTREDAAALVGLPEPPRRPGFCPAHPPAEPPPPPPRLDPRYEALLDKGTALFTEYSGDPNDDGWSWW